MHKIVTCLLLIAMSNFIHAQNETQCMAERAKELDAVLNLPNG